MIDNFIIRQAKQDDLKDIVNLLADDELGKLRENTTELAPGYDQAFAQIKQDPNAQLWVMEAQGKIIATAQVNYLNYLTYQGGKRALIEAVRVDKNIRSQGLGAKLMQHIIAQAKTHGCQMVQLTTNKARTRAKVFYEKLGFIASHEGMKLFL